ncbi:MAG: hypothetical protein L0212_02680, partial [Acidobacteria bacterium]|nr:hypothetical protein [Acidobacteriota bacterium]
MKRTGFILALAIALLTPLCGAWAQSQESIAEYARRMRAERAKKEGAKVKMYTNDNVPGAGGVVSAVGGIFAPAEGGAAPEGAAEGAATVGAGEGQAPAAEGEAKECGEACWKGKFSEQRAKVAAAEKELDILQREYNLARTQ